jgi:hypothetical protein
MCCLEQKQSIVNVHGALAAIISLQSVLNNNVDDRSPSQMSVFIRRLAAFKSSKRTSNTLLQDRYPPLPRVKVVHILITKDIGPEASSNNAPFAVWPAHIERVKPK